MPAPHPTRTRPPLPLSLRSTGRVWRRIALSLAAAVLLAACSEPEPDTQIRIYIAQNEELGAVDALGLDAGDSVDLVVIATRDGAPVSGERVSIVSSKDNLITHPVPRTDERGRATTRILAQNPGQDAVRASLTDGTERELSLRVSDGDHAGHRSGDEAIDESREDVVQWSVLAALETYEEDDRLHASFPESIEALDEQTIRLKGFMMPLDTDSRQRRFLLTQSTPTCFYCVPGGAESAVEIEARDGVEFSFEPMVLEGTFELKDANEMGIFYRLRDARPVDGS